MSSETARRALCFYFRARSGGRTGIRRNFVVVRPCVTLSSVRGSSRRVYLFAFVGLINFLRGSEIDDAGKVGHWDLAGLRVLPRTTFLLYRKPEVHLFCIFYFISSHSKSVDSLTTSFCCRCVLFTILTRFIVRSS